MGQLKNVDAKKYNMNINLQYVPRFITKLATYITNLQHTTYKANFQHTMPTCNIRSYITKELSYKKANIIIYVCSVDTLYSVV